jgi:hypothetical protein
MTKRFARWRRAALLSVAPLLLGAFAVGSPPPPPPPMPTVAVFQAFDVLTRIPWSQTGYGSKEAANNAFVVGGATGAGELADVLVPMDRPLKMHFGGVGQSCRFRVAMFDGAPPYGAWRDKPAHVWHVNVPGLPHTTESTAKAFFEFDPAGSGIATRKLVVSPVNEKGHACVGPTMELVVTFAAAGHYNSILRGLKTNPIQLHQTWPGPTTQGVGFSFTVEGSGPVEGLVDLTLEGPGFPAHTAKLPLTPATAGVQFPALLQGTSLASFPALKNLPAGNHKLTATIKGADGTLLRTATSHVHVLVAAPPPAKGAAITGLTSDLPGYFAGDAQAMTVTGTPGDLGTCDAYALQLAPAAGGAAKSVQLTNKKFPEKLSSAGDFPALGDGVWRAWLTPSGKLCTGTPGDALVQVETPTPSFVKDRPTLTMAKNDFVSEQAKLSIALPSSYAVFTAAGTPVGCCETELYFKNKSGAWARNGGTINRNFSDWDTDDASTFTGVLLYDEFMQNPDAVEWALRVRATAQGRQFAWSNLARFTVK